VGGFTVLCIHKIFDVRLEVKCVLTLAGLKPSACMLGWHYSEIPDPLSSYINGT
jgi:hypothetical protein